MTCRWTRWVLVVVATGMLASACSAVSDAPQLDATAQPDATSFHPDVGVSMDDGPPVDQGPLPPRVDMLPPDSGGCPPGQIESCPTGLPGICEKGQRTCSAGKWGSCIADLQPGAKPEQCSNLQDDDCDGEVDGADSDCFVCTAGQIVSCASGLPGACSQGKKTCSSAGKWGSCIADLQPGAKPEQCSNLQDDDCDGAVDKADVDCQCLPNTSQVCTTGLPAPCHMGKQACTYQSGVWDWAQSCSPVGSPETLVANQCNGQDDDCDGKKDDGTSIQGTVHNMECLTEYTSNRLFGHYAKTLLFHRWSDSSHNDTYALFQLEPAPGAMKAIGTASAKINSFAGGSFMTAAEMQNADALMVLPAKSFNNMVVEESLIIFTKDKVKVISLVSKKTQTQSLASWGIPSGSGGVITDHITAATVLRQGAFPTLTEDIALVTRGSQAWLLSATLAKFNGPYAITDLLNPPGTTGCPSNLANVSSLTTYVDPLGNHTFAFTVGNTLYFSPVLLDAAGGLYYQWKPAPLSNVSCAH